MTAKQPQQPGLRSFIVMNRLPPNCIAFPVMTNDSVPHLRIGDVAVVDTSDRTPAAGELFVIEWGRSNPRGPERCVIELWTRELRNGDGPFVGWFAGAYARPRSYEAIMASAQQTGVVQGLVDGPYPDAGAKHGDYLPSLLIGRIVGILEPDFDEPRRLSAGAAS